MSEVNKEKVAEMRAKLEASNERRRELLRKVVEIAEHALAHQPENVRECWCHFNAAQLALRQMMRPNPNTLAFVNEKWWYKENDAGFGNADPAPGTGKAALLRKVVEIAEHALAQQPEGGENPGRLNAAVLCIRNMMRPKPNTLGFDAERWWYAMNDTGRRVGKKNKTAEIELTPEEINREMGLGPVDPAAGSGAFITPKAVMDDPAMQAVVEPQGKPISPDAPEMVRGEKKAIGNFTGERNVVSYAIDEMYAITVTASTTGDGVWSFKGIKNGETEIMGTILGGKWKAMQYCKFIRNGIVSRAKKVWKNHHRRAEMAAAALADARSDAAGAN